MASKRLFVGKALASFVVASCRDLQHAAVNQIKSRFLNESRELQEGVFSKKKKKKTSSNKQDPPLVYVCCLVGLTPKSFYITDDD